MNNIIRKWAMKMNTEASKEETQMVNKHFKRTSAPSVTMEMQLKITLRFQFTLVTRAIVPCGEMALQEKVLAMQTWRSDLDLCTTSKVRWGSICNLALLQWDGRAEREESPGSLLASLEYTEQQKHKRPPSTRQRDHHAVSRHTHHLHAHIQNTEQTGKMLSRM